MNVDILFNVQFSVEMLQPLYPSRQLIMLMCDNKQEQLNTKPDFNYS